MKDMTSTLIRISVIAGVCIVFLAALVVYMSERAEEAAPTQTTPVKK